MVQPINSRKRDIVYLVFFFIHLPIMFAVDLTPLYPTSIKPMWMIGLREWYITTYKDRFFYDPPSWFLVYTYMEALYHVPLTIWAIPALLNSSPRLPLHLLIFALQTGITTLTCLAEMLSWEELSVDEKWGLGGMYGGYLALAVFMGVDMFARLDKRISKDEGLEPVNTKKDL